jgi:RimJ/RimL family protein N-acetyltransferase
MSIGSEVIIRPLEGDGLSVALRPVTADEFATECLPDPAARRFATVEDQEQLAQPDRVYSHVATSTNQQLWGIAAGRGEDFRLVGFAAMRKTGSRFPIVGWAIRSEWHRQGIGTQVVLGQAAFALEHLQAGGLRADTLLVNESAQALLRAVGFMPLPRVRKPNPMAYGLEGGISWLTYWTLFANTQAAPATISPNIVAASAATYAARRERVEVVFA